MTPARTLSLILTALCLAPSLRAEPAQGKEKKDEVPGAPVASALPTPAPATPQDLSQPDRQARSTSQAADQARQDRPNPQPARQDEGRNAPLAAANPYDLRTNPLYLTRPELEGLRASPYGTGYEVQGNHLVQTGPQGQALGADQVGAYLRVQTAQALYAQFERAMSSDYSPQVRGEARREAFELLSSPRVAALFSEPERAALWEELGAVRIPELASRERPTVRGATQFASGLRAQEGGAGGSSLLASAYDGTGLRDGVHEAAYQGLGTQPATLGGASGARQARAPPRAGGAWDSVESANFRIFHQGRPELAGRALQIAEETRRQVSGVWDARGNCPGGRCDVYLHPDAAAYSRGTGAPPNSPGHSTISADGERVLSRRIDLHVGDASNFDAGNDPNSLRAVLRHEVTHTTLANLPGGPIPRWADEGMAVLSEPPDRVRAHLDGLARTYGSEAGYRDRQLFTARQLMGMTDYPESSRIGTFYAQGVSLTKYMTELGSPGTFSQFLRDARTQGYDRALQTHYRLDFDQLQRDWSAYARGGSRDAAGRDFSAYPGAAGQPARESPQRRPETPAPAPRLVERARDALPDFQLIGPGGSPTTLAELQRSGGRPALLQFTMGDNCVWCQRNDPDVRRLREQFGRQGLAVVGIYDGQGMTDEQIRRHAREHGLEYYAVDRPDASGRTLASRYGVGGYPHFFLAGADGRQAWQGSGGYPLRDARFSDALAAALRPPTAPPAEPTPSQPPAGPPQGRPERQGDGSVLLGGGVRIRPGNGAGGISVYGADNRLLHNFTVPQGQTADIYPGGNYNGALIAFRDQQGRFLRGLDVSADGSYREIPGGPGAQPAPDQGRGNGTPRPEDTAVRIQGRGFGSGAVIDSRPDGNGGFVSLVLTAAHVVENTGNGQRIPAIGIDLPGGQGRASGRVLDTNSLADVALLTVRTPNRLSASPVVGLGFRAQEGQLALMTGFPRGGAYSEFSTRVLQLNRFAGPDNLQTQNPPLGGRSGSGLFNANGQVMGVCNAAGDCGVYAGPQAIHQLLARNNRSDLIPGAVSGSPALRALLASAGSPNFDGRQSGGGTYYARGGTPFFNGGGPILMQGPGGSCPGGNCGRGGPFLRQGPGGSCPGGNCGRGGPFLRQGPGRSCPGGNCSPGSPFISQRPGGQFVPNFDGARPRSDSVIPTSAPAPQTGAPVPQSRPPSSNNKPPSVKKPDPPSTDKKEEQKPPRARMAGIGCAAPAQAADGSDGPTDVGGWGFWAATLLLARLIRRQKSDTVHVDSTDS